ncbi:MAG: hypothetical protein WKF66_09065 [Pedobacter sp.]
MENSEENNSKELLNDDIKFENADVDPGFSPHEEESDESKEGDSGELTGREDKRENDIDAGLSISEMREGKKEGKEVEDSDALNYKNDRENGAYNPKNI